MLQKFCPRFRLNISTNSHTGAPTETAAGPTAIGPGPAAATVAPAKGVAPITPASDSGDDSESRLLMPCGTAGRATSLEEWGLCPIVPPTMVLPTTADGAPTGPTAGPTGTGPVEATRCSTPMIDLCSVILVSLQI